MNNRLTMRARGVGLIEIMVGLAVAMVASLVIVQTFSVSEGFKRNTSGSSDAAQQGATLSYYLNTRLQNAGSGLTLAPLLWGCKLHMSGEASYPLAASLPAPFNIVPTTVRVAPLVVFDGGSASVSDVLMLMGGNSTGGNRWFPASLNQTVSGSTVTAMSMTVNNGLSYKPNSYLLIVSRKGNTNAPEDCQLVRTASTFSPTYSTTGYGGKLADAPATTIPVNLSLGPFATSLVATDNSPYVLDQGVAPNWLLMGVDSSNRLRTANLLNAPTTSQIIGENVFLLKALYGVDNDNNNTVDAWEKPAGTWAHGNLIAGAATDEGRVGKILAVRIALVVRSSDVQSGNATTSLTLFPDLPTAAQYSVSLASSAQRYQYQVYDWVVPLRNVKRF